MATVFDAGLAAAFFADDAAAAGFAVFTTGGLREAAAFAAGLVGLPAATGRLAVAGLATGFALWLLLAVALALALPTALVGALSFFTLAAVELRVVFAIFLTPFLAVAAGSYSPCALHRQARFWNTRGTGFPSSRRYVTVLTRLILLLLRFYKRWLSPLLGPRCRFHPSCSDYARIAVTRFGPWRGSLLTAWRLLRCQPLCTGGEDPVPEDFHLPRCRCQDNPPDTR